MRLVLYDGRKLGLLRGDRVVDLSHFFAGREIRFPLTQMHLALDDFPRLRPAFEAYAAGQEGTSMAQARLGPPMPTPTKIIGAFSNYRRHAMEMGGAGEQEEAEVFLKAPSSIVGPGETVVLPDVPGQPVHHEAELAVIIGAKVKAVRPEQALRAVFGYTALMDITVRGKGDRSRRKSYDTFTPLGPALVTADEIPDPQNLGIRLWVDGELRQSANTRDMTVGIAQIIAYASSVMTLYPGDVIATGTPEGVGPIADGQTLAIEIEQVGRMSVKVRGPARRSGPGEA